MLKEALQYLWDSARSSQKAVILQVPGDGRTCTVDQDGKLVTLTIAPPLRAHQVDSVADLIAAAGKWNTAPVIWLNDTCPVLIIDDGDRREKVSLPLKKTKQFSFLENLKSDHGFDQVAMIRALRVDLPGAEKRAELITSIRTLKWRTSSEGSVDIQHGKESLGKSVENEVTGQGQIPELVVVTCPVFRNPGEEQNQFGIGCDLEIDSADQEFIFRPLPDEIENATASALNDIRSRLVNALPSVTILYGKP